MKITQLDIRDFGVFQGEKLEELGDGIIVVGGANRSGKTSLMQILRNVPYGFSKNSKLPPPKFQYDVRCDLKLENGDGVNVLLKGFSSPEIVYNSTMGNNANKGLYDIDKGTYSELFTISLDELNKSSGKEDSNLQAMLLGAGFKQIVKIPQLSKELREKAISIGGTRGNPSTKMFKPFVEIIKKGVGVRKKSILQLDLFLQKKNSLLNLENTIISKTKGLQSSNNNIIKLEVLKHNYELNKNRKNLMAELQMYFFSTNDIKEYNINDTQEFNISDIREYNIEKAKALKSQYIKELEQCNSDNYEFQSEVSKEKLNKELLIDNKVLIRNYYNGISGIKEVVKNLQNVKNEYYEKTGTLMNKIKRSNDNWVSLSDVDEIDCDEVQQRILIQNIEKFKIIEAEKIVCDKKIEDAAIQSEILQKQLLPYNSSLYIKKYFYFTIFFIIIGLGLFFVDKLLGCSIIVIGAIGVALYLFVNSSKGKLILIRNVEIKAQIDNLSIITSKGYKELKEIDESLRELNNIMDEYRDILKLDGRVTTDGIKDYFKTVAYLKDDIYEYYLLKSKLSKLFDDFCETLNIINKVFIKFDNFNSTKDLEKISLDNIYDYCNDFLLKVESLYKHLELWEKNDKSFFKLKILEKEILKFLDESYAEDIIVNIEEYIVQGEKHIKYNRLQNEVKIIEEKLLQGLKSERIKSILYNESKEFTQIDDVNEKLLKIIEELYTSYVNIDEINHEYEVLIVDNKKLMGELDMLKNEKQTLKDQLNAMNSDETLVMCEHDIIEARAQLRPLAERYAVYNTAALLLEKVRERFLLNTKDNLLKGASDILSEITSGEYKDIMPMDDLMQGDFKTKMFDERIMDSSEILSRGTKEQLFLAVRISRIKEIKPSLPVIFDDSFVNFDIAHTKNTVNAIVKLSKSHQIFVLTCHATLVELIMAQSPQAQYFKLDKGKFTKTIGKGLKEYLEEL